MVRAHSGSRANRVLAGKPPLTSEKGDFRLYRKSLTLGHNVPVSQGDRAPSIAQSEEFQVARQIVAEGTAEVDIATLKTGILLRFDGEDLEHAQSLACRLDDCPPILVEKSTAMVIDGAHRVLAAKLLDRETIPVRYFTGTHEEAFVEAVKANVSHGKPLTLAEREAAAKKVLEMHNDWSDRLVAQVCGLSDKTVGRLRKTTAEIPQSTARIGRDGRHRPTDTRLLRNEIADRPAGEARHQTRRRRPIPQHVAVHRARRPQTD